MKGPAMQFQPERVTIIAVLSMLIPRSGNMPGYVLPPLLAFQRRIMRIELPQLHEQWLGWYLHNALSGASGGHLVQSARPYLIYLKPAAAARRLAEYSTPAVENQKLEVRRRTFLRFLAKYAERPEPIDPVVSQNLRFLKDAFGLDDTDIAVLQLISDASQIFNLESFAGIVCGILRNPARTIGSLIGVEPAIVARSIASTGPLRACGLVTINPGGRTLSGDDDERMVGLTPKIHRVLLTPHATLADLTAAILGQPCRSNLEWYDFAHIAEADMAAAVLRAAASGGERGIHVMLVGPAGTGKSEFARTVATQAGLSLYAAGEDETEDGKEPSRSQRAASLRLMLALLVNRRDVAVLLDEAEDVLDSTRSFGEKRDAFSKAFMHRVLESSPVPVIWTCNDIGWMAPATLRRMTLVLRVGVPNEAGRERIWRHVLNAEGLSLGEDVAPRLAARWEASAGIAAGAARAARLAGGGEPALQSALSGVARAVGVSRSARKRVEVFDPELITCIDDVMSIANRLARPGAPRGWSLCISGPSGTGKSAFAHYLADRLGLTVLQKRASDLLSMWVGGTEQRIAAAFGEAEEKLALLLIDEAESLMFDRTAAVRAFEMTQVDELLSWMEQHPLPLICTTNMPDRMDQAVPRRFTFKLRFDPLNAARAALAFRRILGEDPPGPLPDGLTPGDFAVVRRKAALLDENRPAIWLEWLAEELAAKGNKRPIGFRPQAPEPRPAIRLSRLLPVASGQCGCN